MLCFPLYYCWLLMYFLKNRLFRHNTLKSWKADTYTQPSKPWVQNQVAPNMLAKERPSDQKARVRNKAISL